MWYVNPILDTKTWVVEIKIKKYAAHLNQLHLKKQRTFFSSEILSLENKYTFNNFYNSPATSLINPPVSGTEFLASATPAAR